MQDIKKYALLGALGYAVGKIIEYGVSNIFPNAPFVAYILIGGIAFFMLIKK